MSSSNDILDDKIKNIIAKLCESRQFDPNEAECIIKDLKNIYQDGYRHKYSQITKIILEKSDSEEDGLAILGQNLRTLEEFVQKSSTDDTLNQVKYKLEKLLDHINLEILRLGDSSKNFDKLNSKSNELQDKFNNLQETSSKIEDKLNSKSNELQDKFNNLQETSSKIEDKLNKQQTQYITILGIFASIVLAFVGGFTFSTSALSNIDKASIYRLVFVLSFIALFFGNILFALFRFLSKFNTHISDESKKWYQQPILYFNAVAVLIMMLDCVAYFLFKDCL
ncbi:hypothetical protein HRAG_00945 [Helicobacter bilis ATCC 43879]|uniref:Uncharacterized protein n=1 Tax=Helicobacter bilis ATCC 43879 TaxID=613026 RepID=C3XFU9_9HELI|nr:hypothetical protein [Helicobacter bilis]EEO23888.1 hypothetical protein HRAG_00945 [Helicobacter bilis ATCC 43879]